MIMSFWFLYPPESGRYPERTVFEEIADAFQANCFPLNLFALKKILKNPENFEKVQVRGPPQWLTRRLN